MTPPRFVSACNQGSFPPPGFPRLQRYYGPLRHPPRHEALPASLGLPIPVAVDFPCCIRIRLDMPSPIPRRSVGARSLSPSSCPPRGSLPRYRGGSASAIYLSGPARCSLALRPADLQRAFRSPFLPGSGGFVASTAAGIATRLERRHLPGRDFHPLDSNTFHGTPDNAVSRLRRVESTY